MIGRSPYLSLVGLSAHSRPILIESPLPAAGRQEDGRPTGRSGRRTAPVDPVALARQRAASREQRAARRPEGEPGHDAGRPAAAPPVGGRPILSSNAASPRFVAQLLAQGAGGPESGEQRAPARDAAAGSTAYRRAGGEPSLFDNEPAIFRVSV